MASISSGFPSFVSSRQITDKALLQDVVRFQFINISEAVLKQLNNQNLQSEQTERPNIEKITEESIKRIESKGIPILDFVKRFSISFLGSLRDETSNIDKDFKNGICQGSLELDRLMELNFKQVKSQEVLRLLDRRHLKMPRPEFEDSQVYAFGKTGDFDSILAYKNSEPLQEALSKKYTEVQNPQPGDLVLFFDPSNLEGTLGIWREGDFVEMKRDCLPLVYTYKLEDVPASLGLKVAFFHRNPS